MNRPECRKAILRHLQLTTWMRLDELRAYIAHELDTDETPLSIFGLMNDKAKLDALDVPTIWQLWRELRRMKADGLVEAKRTIRFRLNLPVGYTREWRLRRVARVRFDMRQQIRFPVVS